jgi:RNA polymerase sigma-70 factor (ECF subfamily)
MHDDDDGRLLARIQGGDGESFGVLFDRTRRWLLTFVILPRVGPEGAEDVLAETFRTAWDRIGDFEWRGTGLLHWLSSIAKRKALEHGRKSRREADREAGFPDFFDPPDGAPTAEAEMIRLETLRALGGRVTGALAALPPRYAETLRLRLLEGRPRLECAGLLAVSPATFDVLLHRATKAFAKAWRSA